MTDPQQIAIAIVHYQGQYLVGTRAGDQVLGGYSEFPGGKVEPTESIEDAAVRECLEETGIPIEIIRHYPTVTHAYDHGVLELFFLACEPITAPPAPTPPFRWVARQELQQLNFPAANQSVLAILQAE